MDTKQQTRIHRQPALPGLTGTRVSSLLLGVLLFVGGLRPAHAACPFCAGVTPTLSQRRDASVVCALGEAAETTKDSQSFALHKLFKGRDRLANGESISIAVAKPGAAETPSELPLASNPGTLVLLLGNEPAPAADGKPASRDLKWEILPLTEVGYAYVAKLPLARAKTAERLRWAAPFLENSDLLVAQDAYLEFGHAPFDEVVRVADRLSMPKVRDWLRDANVPDERKGLYGLMLGLTDDPRERRQNLELLDSRVEQPGEDFRAGLDGVLGAYLLLRGEEGLREIDRRFLSEAKAPVGHVRHALSALRFYREYGSQIPVEKLAEAVEHVLPRAEFAAAAISDLARWKHWQALDKVLALFDQPGQEDAQIQRAVVGFLLVCPGDEARTELARLRKAAPDRVREAELLMGLSQGNR